MWMKGEMVRAKDLGPSPDDAKVVKNSLRGLFTKQANRRVDGRNLPSGASLK